MPTIRGIVLAAVVALMTLTAPQAEARTSGRAIAGMITRGTTERPVLSSRPP